MVINMSDEGNFTFLRNTNNELFKIMRAAEQMARTNFKVSGNNTRLALEAFIRSVSHKDNLDKDISFKGLDLSGKIKALRSETYLREKGLLKETETIHDHPILPDLGVVSFRYARGAVATEDYYSFLRKFGNTCHHEDRHYNDVELSYKNVLLALKGYHQLFKKYYRKQISKEVGGFEEDWMPIEDYIISSSKVPNDAERTLCKREFNGYQVDANGNPTFYAILRLYEKKESNKTFLIRNQSCFVNASRESINVPEGMSVLREITPYNSDHTSFYIIGYLFNQEPEPLTAKLIKELSMQERIRMCSRLIGTIDYLHNMSTPIYHRMLTYECVYVCKIAQEWVPYIVKFDYAKLTSGTEGTVFADVHKAKVRLKENRLSKYQAPEFERLGDTATAEQWAAADIYSLGMLLSDILHGDFGVFPVTYEELEDDGVPDHLIDILENMRSGDPAQRDNIEYAKVFFTTE